MKIIKRIFILITALSLGAVLGLGAFASESADEDYTASDTAASADATAGSTTDSTDTENPFETVFNTLGNYSSEIFSALAFLGTLIVAHFYKKGMLPTLRSALGNISSALTTASDKTDSALAPIGERTEKIKCAIEHTAGITEGISASLEEVEKRLAELGESRGERIAYKTIMLSQIDMLYDIFMSTALPQYKKDEIGEKVAAMKRELRLSDEGGAEALE